MLYLMMMTYTPLQMYQLVFVCYGYGEYRAELSMMSEKQCEKLEHVSE